MVDIEVKTEGFEISLDGWAVVVNPGSAVIKGLTEEPIIWTRTKKLPFRPHAPEFSRDDAIVIAIDKVEKKLSLWYIFDILSRPIKNNDKYHFHILQELSW
jgi:hypothetical protein